jgi:hypothetical protein
MDGGQVLHGQRRVQAGNSSGGLMHGLCFSSFGCSFNSHFQHRSRPFINLQQLLIEIGDGAAMVAA